METGYRTELLSISLAVAALVGGAGCPCSGGPRHLTFFYSEASYGAAGQVIIDEDIMRWSADRNSHREDWIVASYPLDAELSGDPLEFYHASGERLNVEHFDQETEYVASISCPHNERSYALTDLEDGEYTLVHRRRNGTGDPVWCAGECPWGEFEGEEALVIRLTVEPLEPAP